MASPIMINIIDDHCVSSRYLTKLTDIILNGNSDTTVDENINSFISCPEKYICDKPLLKMIIYFNGK